MCRESIFPFPSRSTIDEVCPRCLNVPVLGFSNPHWRTLAYAQTVSRINRLVRGMGTGWLWMTFVHYGAWTDIVLHYDKEEGNMVSVIDSTIH